MIVKKIIIWNKKGKEKDRNKKKKEETRNRFIKPFLQGLQDELFG